MKILLVNDTGNPNIFARAVGQLHSRHYATVEAMTANTAKVEEMLKEKTFNFVVLDFDDQFERISMANILASKFCKTSIVLIHNEPVIDRGNNILVFKDIFDATEHFRQDE